MKTTPHSDIEYMKDKTFRNRKKRRREPADNNTIDPALHPRHRPYEREREQDWLRAVDYDTDGYHEFPDPE